MADSPKHYTPDGLQSFGSKLVERLRGNEFVAITVGVVLLVGFVLAVALAMAHSSRVDRSLNALHQAQGDLAALDKVLEENSTGRTRPFILMEVAATAMRRPQGVDDVETSEARAERLNKAANALVELTERHRNHALRFPALKMLAAVREEQGSYDEALSLYQSALGIAPTSFEPLIRYSIGRMLVLLDRPSEAIPHIQEALAQASPTVFIPYQGRYFEESAVWYQNAEYLLADIGAADKFIRLPEPKPVGPSGAEDASGAEAAPDVEAEDAGSQDSND